VANTLAGNVRTRRESVDRRPKQRKGDGGLKQHNKPGEWSEIFWLEGRRAQLASSVNVNGMEMFYFFLMLEGSQSAIQFDIRWLGVSDFEWLGKLSARRLTDVISTPFTPVDMATEVIGILQRHESPIQKIGENS
jgi:hypothetical protein